MAKKSRKQKSRQTGTGRATPQASSPASRADSRRAQRVLQERQAKRKRIYTLFGGAAAAALVLALVLVLVNMDSDGGAAGDPVSIPPAIPAEIPREGRVLGNPDAPVKIVEYGDYQCPACGQFSRSMKPQLIQDYIAGGDVSYEYRDFAFLGDESMQAARASICAMDQDMFWDFHNTLFNNQGNQNDGGAFAKQRLVRMAENLDMDVDAFEDCIDGSTYRSDVTDSTQRGQAEGVRATPTFFINERMMEGVSSYDAFRQEIDAALQNAGS